MIEFALDLGYYVGWMELTIRSDERKIRIDCAWNGDSPKDLTEGFIMLAGGDGHVDLWFTDERCDFIVRLRRVAGTLSVTVKRVDDVEMQDLSQTLFKRALDSKDWSRIPVVQGKKAVFRGEGPFKDAATSLVAGMHNLLSQAGSAEEYKARWGFAFPSDELARLEQSIAAI